MTPEEICLFQISKFSPWQETVHVVVNCLKMRIDFQNKKPSISKFAASQTGPFYKSIREWCNFSSISFSNVKCVAVIYKINDRLIVYVNTVKWIARESDFGGPWYHHHAAKIGDQSDEDKIAWVYFLSFRVNSMGYLTGARYLWSNFQQHVNDWR